MADETRIFLHPLAIMNIADHQARYVGENVTGYDPKNPPRVLGAIFGMQKGASVEVISSIELPYRINEEKQIRIDEDSFAEDTNLYKQIYPEHECLGWYSTATDIKDTDLPFHRRFTEYNESPLYLRMDPLPKKTDKSLPVTVYRMELKVVKDKTDQVFVELPFKVYSEPAERLTTDHVMRNKDVATKGSQIVPQFDEMKNAMVSLQQRIELLIEYLTAVETKKVAPNREVLELIQGVTNRLPTMSSEKFREDFSNELSSGLIMTYLAAMTKAAAKVNDSFDLYELTGDGGRGARSRAMRRFG